MMQKTPNELGDVYRAFINDYPIVSIEDPFDQDDWEGYSAFTASVSCQVVGYISLCHVICFGTRVY